MATRFLLIFFALCCLQSLAQESAKVIILSDEEAQELQQIKRQWDAAIARISARRITGPGWEYGLHFTADFKAAIPMSKDGACTPPPPEEPRDLIGHPDYGK